MPRCSAFDISNLFSTWYYQLETYECNLDFVQDNAIEHGAEFYCWCGIWENVREQARFELELLKLGDNPRLKSLLTPLQRALETYEAYDAKLGTDITETQAKKLYHLEYALVKELLGFYDDPQLFVVAHVLDTVYDNSEAWLIFDRYEGEESLKLLEPFKLKVLSA
jgi:hypothetical protein